MLSSRPVRRRFRQGAKLQKPRGQRGSGKHPLAEDVGHCSHPRGEGEKGETRLPPGTHALGSPMPFRPLLFFTPDFRRKRQNRPISSSSVAILSAVS